jgi:hypothetical protein
MAAVLPMLHPEPVATKSTQTWPEETELCFAPGRTKVMLTIQCRLVCVVIQDSIETLQASLVFENAFPDGVQGLAFVWHALISAAERHLPAALSIHNRLRLDDEYISKIIPVVHAYSLTT